MTEAEYVDTLIGLGNLATASGLSEHEQALSLLLVALGVADRNSREGCSRETFLRMAGVVHDRCRKSLAAGTPT